MQSVVDFGCGRGAWLRAFQENGVERLLGIEGAAIDDTHQLVDAGCIQRRDIAKPISLARAYDLAVCLEVAEHLAADAGPVLVRSLTDSAPLVLFSAAIPGQGGTHHVNERWPFYWQELFDQQNFERLDPIRPRLRGLAEVKWWYRQNIFLFVDRSHQAFGRFAGLPKETEHPFRVTVALCTSNRATILDRTLDNMSRLRIPAGTDWELLVVKNNCTDDLDDVIERHAKSLPIRPVWEPMPGLSRARNRAVSEASGNLVVFTDDDVLVHQSWLYEYVEAARKWPEAVYFGGPIEPLFEIEPPSWLKDNMTALSGLFGIHDLGPSLRVLNDQEFPSATNMAFRATVFKDLRFDEQLARLGAEMMCREASQLAEQLSRRGHIGVWVGAARVMRRIRPEMFRAHYVWRCFHGYGRTLARLDARNTSENLAGASGRRIRKHWKRRIGRLMSRPFFGPRWLVVFLRLAFLTGILAETFASVDDAESAMAGSRR